MFDRDIRMALELRKRVKMLLARHDLTALVRGIKRIGSGTYNDVFKIFPYETDPSGNPKDAPSIVMRLSYYDLHVLQEALKSLDGHIVKSKRKLTVSNDDAKLTACRINRVDPVKVKNNYSIVCQNLIVNRICPNLVYIYHHTDYRNFFDHVKHLVPEKRLAQPQQEFTNISFHELYTTNLHHAILNKMVNEDQLRNIMFQVMYALATLQHYLPGFRHNDLSASNILLKLYPCDASRHHTYGIPGTSFGLKDEGVFAAVWDFDLAHAPGRCVQLDKYAADMAHEGYNLRNYIILNSKFSNYKKDTSVQNINDVFNPSFDTYFFLSSTLKALKGLQGFSSIRKRITDCMPRFQGTRPTYIGTTYDALVPLNMLNGDMFADYKISDGNVQCDFSFKPFNLGFICQEGSDNTPAIETYACDATHTIYNPTVNTLYTYQ